MTGKISTKARIHLAFVMHNRVIEKIIGANGLLAALTLLLLLN